MEVALIVVGMIAMAVFLIIRSIKKTNRRRDVASEPRTSTPSGVVIDSVELKNAEVPK